MARFVQVGPSLFLVRLFILIGALLSFFSSFRYLEAISNFDSSVGGFTLFILFLFLSVDDLLSKYLFVLGINPI